MAGSTMTNHHDEGVSIVESSPIPGVIVSAENDEGRRYVLVLAIATRRPVPPGAGHLRSC